ncbi:1-phosphatidylinositol 4,5-bisphosphate phosphodiesterase gamma-1 isoform X2 [Wyeomyia smithii]|uniref:1-phosphatidylinositol 4,5-bisphosphate phosphodiesterase gamma-1 isoform X2 n=1 Tax=Wyeomyia smithii TaxID=174621 RepID=UPI002467EA61|nr:1-phosphatidylinositol 4,5-bisphosphate phosphodiesterase gamma-1 isoform X2 [Wyeomyia smithii]
MTLSFDHPALGEMEQIICSLERGTLIQKFYPRRKPDMKTLMLQRETHQVTWSPPGQSNRADFEGAFELREVKEIRIGRGSKDFEKWTEEAKKVEHRKCFIIFYGNEFKLRSLSVVALSERECEMWIKGLKHMVADAVNAPYWLKVERWLRKEFYAMENSRDTVSLKELKSFFPKVNYKMTTAKLSEVFHEVDTRRRNELGFDDFARLYQKIMAAQRGIQEYIGINVQTITSKEFQKFLNEKQNDPLTNELEVSSIIREYVQDPIRDVQEPYLKIQEFIDFLFSRQNEIWNKECDKIYHDMNRPLAHYWISSSHNTYLTGDQFSSESSVEAYARALRMGCRCIELDCWDGPDNMPLIFHGHTFTTKIKFRDVIQAIKEHAFVTSEYPVILSIEQNCSLAQQRKMACAMQDIFGDMLLTQQIEKNEQQLPSPSQLKRKIVLKHKKLPENAGKFEDFIVPSDGSLIRPDETELDIRNTVKNGILFLEDPVDKVWNPHFFVLTQHKLFYTDSQSTTEKEDMREEENEPSLSNYKESITNDELHFGENWFHGKLPGGREEAESLLRQYAHLGDGTFLVRESVTFVGDYCLSFWRQGKPNHCRIKLKQDKGVTKYYLMENNYFDNLYSLIIFYRQNSLRSAEFYITLKEPVPQPNKHESKEWYHGNTSREQSEIILHHLQNDGAFLVRPSDKGSNAYVISFRANHKIKHCRIKVEGRLYSVGGMEFESLIDLVNFYMKHPLYKKVKLTHPISRDMMKRINTMSVSVIRYLNSLNEKMFVLQAPDDNGVYSYMDPSSVNEKITVKALYDYKAQREDELSFCKHAIITNVDKKGNELWWTGNYGGKKQHYFPANYVQEINTADGSSDDSGSDTQMLGSLQKGSLDVNGAVVELTYGPHPELDRILRIQNPLMQNVFEIGVQSKELAIEWMSSIKEVAQNASVLENERRKMERNSRVAKEMSDMIIYCRSVPFKNTGWVFYEMSSFPETKAEKYFLQQETELFVRYHNNQISRVYPKGQRLDSSNYNPIPFWNTGSQMIALNFQTPDKWMQLNQAKFRDNGACGYVLKPDFMFREGFNPNDPNTLIGVEEKTITIGIIGARHLCRGGRNITSPLVEIELLGANFDNGVKHRTRSIADNGFNPFWKEVCEFKVVNPGLAMLRFEVQDEDMFGEPNFIGQAVFPVNAIRTGFRSVPLRNKFSEELELATLLVHIVIRSSNEENG